MSDERLARIEGRIDQLRDKLGEECSRLYQRVEAERLATQQELDRRLSDPPWWQGAARLALYGLTILFLAGGVGFLILHNLMPEGAWDAALRIIEREADL